MIGRDNPAYSPDEGGIQLRNVQRIGSGSVDPQDLQRIRAGLAAGSNPGSTPGCIPGTVQGYIPGPTQDPMPGPMQGTAPETTPQGTTRQGTQETRFGATNGVSEAKRKPTWSLPDVDFGLSRVKDKAIGFVRQGSSKVSMSGAFERVKDAVWAVCK